MSSNFYYILTLNVSHPTVRAFLTRIGWLEHSTSMLDLKVRSKFYLSWPEVFEQAQEDFVKKMDLLYPTREGEKDSPMIKPYSITNPAHATTNEVLQQVLAKFNGNEGSWEKNCCAALFFCEAVPGEDEGDAIPDEWMVKYEIYTVKDTMEMPLNGEQTFRPSELGAYH